MMENTDEKIRIGVWLHPSTVDEVDKIYKYHNNKNRSEYIEDAIRFYTGYLASEKSHEYFSTAITSTVQSTLNTFEDRMASLLFKMAVELAMLMNVEAAHYRVDDQTLTRLRNKCVGEVKRLHGRVSFDDAVKYQRGD